jgi:hypothetical protein
MAQPSASLATQRPDLAASMEEFDLAQDRMGFIAQRVLPVVEVGAQAGTFGKIPVEQLLQTRDTKRAPGSGYARGTFKFEPATYATEEHGAEEPVDDRESKMYANYFDHEIVSTQRAYDAVLRNAELRAAALVFNATTWTGAALTTGITNEWDDIASAVPITDVAAAVVKVWSGSGLWPNALVINRKVFNNLRRCAQIIDAIRSTGAGSPTKQSDITVAQLAAVFDLRHIIVAGGAQNTGKEGAALTVAPTWSDEYAMVCKVAESDDFREPCIGRTFHWGEDGSEIGGLIETYREETVRGSIVRVRHDVDEVVLYAAAGHLLSNVTT